MVNVNTSPTGPTPLILSRSNSENDLPAHNKCPRCHKPVTDSQPHVELLTYVVNKQQYHSECATCSHCSTPIHTGETSLSDSANQVYCRSCFNQVGTVATSNNAFSLLSSLLLSLWSAVLYLVRLPFALCQTLYYDIFLGQILLYNVSFEDARIDRRTLNVKGKVVLTLTSAGDNVLDAVTEGASKVIAVDQNIAQCSLMELKMAAIRHLQYEQVWAIFGVCDGNVFRSVYHSHLRPHLSAQAQKYWDGRQYYIDGFYYRGGSGVFAWLMVHVFCPLTGTKRMMDEIVNATSLQEQQRLYATWRPYFHRVMRILYWLGAWKFFAWLVAVPTNQQSLLSTNWEHYIEDVLDHLCTKTWLNGKNHYYAIYMRGYYTPNNCPRYLQRQWFSFLKQNIHRVDLKCGNLFTVMQDIATAGQTVDRFNLLDHMDWMKEETVLYEWSLISAIASKDALAIWKSISEISSPNVLGYLPNVDADTQHAIDHFLHEEDCTPTYRSIRVVRVPTKDEMLFKPRIVPAITNSSWSNDAKVLYAMYVMPVLRKLGLSSEEKHAAVATSPSATAAASTSVSRTNMNAFYAPQAALYDSYRHRMLHGRSLMASCLPIKQGGIWVDVGGGTAFNLEYCADVLSAFQRVYVVDVCDHLLVQADRRIKANGWNNVTTIQRDVCQAGILTPEESALGCDLITFSYSLTMIPQWREALQAAYDMLKPGGIIAITDFTVLPKAFQSPVMRGLFTRTFAIDGVKLSEQHRKELVDMFAPCVNEVRWGGFPYIPFLSCPYYVFVGRKPESAGKLIWRGSPVAKKQTTVKRSMSGLMLAEASLAS